MGIRILVGTEPGSDFKHACFFDSSRDTAFGPLFYESGKPHFLDPGDIAEAFGKWVGWDKLAFMSVEEMKDKESALLVILQRDPKEAKAEGAAAGKLAVADLRGTSTMERLEERKGPQDNNAEFSDAYDEVIGDEWGRLSTDGEHPWAIVLAQEDEWHKGFREGFELAFAAYLVEAAATLKALEGK